MKKTTRKNTRKVMAFALGLLVMSTLYACSLREDETAASGGTDAKDYIGLDSAKQIAAENAGFTVSEVTFTEGKLDVDDDGDEPDVYDIEFVIDGMEYDYEINAKTGEILKQEKEAADGVTTTITTTTAAEQTTAPEAQSEQTTTTTTTTTTTAQTSTEKPAETTTTTAATQIETPSAEFIGALRAEEIALESGGFTRAEADFIRSELDIDDDGDEPDVYEVEYIAGGFEYDYEINAVTGEIIKSETEKADVQIPQAGTVTDIESAKTAALNHAGVAASAATFTKAELDVDDDGDEPDKYDIEFYAGGFEYEYEINAATGEIISFEKDLDD